MFDLCVVFSVSNWAWGRELKLNNRGTKIRGEEKKIEQCVRRNLGALVSVNGKWMIRFICHMAGRHVPFPYFLFLFVYTNDRDPHRVRFTYACDFFLFIDTEIGCIQIFNSYLFNNLSIYQFVDLSKDLRQLCTKGVFEWGMIIYAVDLIRYTPLLYPAFRVMNVRVTGTRYRIARSATRLFCSFVKT